MSSLRATLMLLLDRKERDRRLHKEISRTDCWKREEWQYMNELNKLMSSVVTVTMNRAEENFCSV